MKNNIFIISGPSGAGEDSVIDGLKKFMPVERIITTTTRKMRPEEKSGREYYFINRNDFIKLIKEKQFFEYAQEYNDNYYGVTFDEINRVRASRKIGIWKIEYKGVITAKKKYPEIKSIFIAPPSLEILEKRILQRDQDASPEYLKERKKYTEEWLKHRDIYDYKVVNEEGELEETVKKVIEIIKSNLSA